MHRSTPAALSASLLLTLAGSLHAAPAPPTGIPGVQFLANLNGFTGVRFDGIDEYDNSGRSVSSAGDINGDGIDDIVIGAPYADPGANSAAGEVYVVFGRKQLPSDQSLADFVNLSSLDGTNGFVLTGAAVGDNAGRSVSAVGDINADKIDDLIIGAPFANPNGVADAGSAYVLFGRKVTPSTPFPAVIALSSLTGSTGFRLDGGSPGERAGLCVAGAGDINGDKIDDLAIGAPFADVGSATDAGTIYVVFGHKATAANPFGTVNLDSLSGTDGFHIDGVDADDNAGFSVAAAGDFNADKIDDLIIGAPRADGSGNSEADAGEAYVVFGSKLPRHSMPRVSLDLASLDATTGFNIPGIDPDDRAGFSVAPAGDVNADGVDDVIIGAPRAEPTTNTSHGEAYVLFGRKATPANPLPASLDLSALTGTNGSRLLGPTAGDYAGNSVAAAGDVNGDGIDDVIVGAYYSNVSTTDYVGSSYVMFGRKDTPDDPFPASVILSTLGGTRGYRLNGGDESDYTGISVASAGDFNGDGRGDVIIGANRGDANTDAGQTYIVFGPAAETQVVLYDTGIENLSQPVVADAGTISLGNVDLGNTLTATFRIENLGLADLSVAKLKVPKGFAVSTPPDASIIPLESTDLDVTITPRRAGSFAGKLSFTTNDLDEAKYDFTVQWTVNAALAVETSASHITDLDSLPDLNNDWATDTADLLLMLRALNADDAPDSADLNQDGVLSTDDLVVLLTRLASDR